MSIYNIPKYCTYLTIYSGDKLPSFYIGSGKVENILNKKKPYHGTVSSKKYRKTWDQELKENPHLFKTIILEKFYSRKNAFYNERLLQIKFNVVKSKQFINRSIAYNSGFFGIDNSEMKKEYYSDPENRNKLSIILKEYVSKNPEFIEDIRVRVKEYWSNEENKKMASDIKKEFYKNPENVESISGGNNSAAKSVEINGLHFECMNHAAKYFNVNRNTLRKILNGNIKLQEKYNILSHKYMNVALPL